MTVLLIIITKYTVHGHCTKCEHHTMTELFNVYTVQSHCNQIYTHGLLPYSFLIVAANIDYFSPLLNFKIKLFPNQNKLQTICTEMMS